MFPLCIVEDEPGAARGDLSKNSERRRAPCTRGEIHDGKFRVVCFSGMPLQREIQKRADETRSQEGKFYRTSAVVNKLTAAVRRVL